MARLLSSQSVETLKVLLDQLAKVEGGSLDIGAFADWFKSFRWDASTGFNTSELAPLGWAVETSLFEYEDFPDEYTVEDLKDAVLTVFRREGFEPLDVTLSQRGDIFSVYAGGSGAPLSRRYLHRLPDQDQTEMAPPLAVVTIPA